MQSAYGLLLTRLLNSGISSTDRTGVGTTRVFGAQLRYDISHQIPIITERNIPYKQGISEMFAFIHGETTQAGFEKWGCTFWKKWAKADGSFGPIYGAQWRHWPSTDGGYIDQLANVIEALRTNPYSRRHVVSAWNPADIPNMALPPCHVLFNFVVMPPNAAKTGNDKPTINISMYQRSVDVPIGLPFNLIGYTVLVHLIANLLDYNVGEFLWHGDDVHFYNNQHDAVVEMSACDALPFPKITIGVTPGSLSSIDDYHPEHVIISGYESYPAISIPVAV